MHILGEAGTGKDRNGAAGAGEAEAAPSAAIAGRLKDYRTPNPPCWLTQGFPFDAASLFDISLLLAGSVYQCVQVLRVWSVYVPPT